MAQPAGESDLDAPRLAFNRRLKHAIKFGWKLVHFLTKLIGASVGQAFSALQLGTPCEGAG